MRHLSIGAHYVLEPIGFWLNGEELLLNAGGDEKGIHSYNLKSQVIRDVQTDYGLPYAFSTAEQCIPYTESLVSLNTGT